LSFDELDILRRLASERIKEENVIWQIEQVRMLPSRYTIRLPLSVPRSSARSRPNCISRTGHIAITSAHLILFSGFNVMLQCMAFPQIQSFRAINPNSSNSPKTIATGVANVPIQSLPGGLARSI